jgi:ketol-acid reductoisomerase
MRYSISDTAEYGDYVSGPRVVDAHTRETMGKLLEEIQLGHLRRKWIDENEAGRPGSRRSAPRSAICPSSRSARSCAR